MPIREIAKILMITNHITLTELVNLLNAKYDRHDSIQNLGKKINRGTLKYQEAEEIADVLGYKIEWVKRDNIK